MNDRRWQRINSGHEWLHWGRLERLATERSATTQRTLSASIVGDESTATLAVTNTIPILSPDELLELCGNAWSRDAYSAPDGNPCLLVDLRRPLPMSLDDPAYRFMMQLPCPTIGIGPCNNAAHARDLAKALDTTVDQEQELAAIIRNVTAHPMAAATLVQLLRHNESTSVEAGLHAESLAYATLQGSRDFRSFLSRRPVPITRQDDAEPLVAARTGDILNIALNRPGRHNAYSASMRDAFYETLRWLEADDSLERAEVRGEGDCFCTGGDLSEFGQATDPAEAHLIRMSRPVGLLMHRLRHRITFHVHRACIGSGIELPAFAGRVVATADTFFQLPEITMGLIPGAGGTVSILKRIGRQNMTRWALSARRIRAATALEWGLIDAIAG